uniref:Uncharacterized protein n=1 Tax=Fagus sylvatica TaxID=28930 RepID=A0A2N9FWW8_FAGSY
MTAQLSLEASSETQRNPLLNPPTHFHLGLRLRGRPSPPAGSEPPPPPPPSLSSNLPFHPQSPDLVLHEGDLMESLGGSSLQQISSLLSANLTFPVGDEILSGGGC